MKKPDVFVAKDRVEHSRFGPGTVLEANGRYTSIRFDTAGTGTKKFVTTMVQLVHSDAPAPVKPVRGKSSKSKDKKK